MPFRRELQPPARQLYERDGFVVGRQNRAGWAMAKGQPPCHRSKSGHSFSININHGGFCCFGCDTRGSMADYVMLRDHCDFRAAAKTLGVWWDVTSAERFQLDAAKYERERARELAAKAKELERRQRIAIRDEVHSAARIEKTASGRLSELRHGAEPTFDGEEETCWAVMSLAFDDLRDSEERYMKAAGLEYLG
jgi:hypothetical protein